MASKKKIFYCVEMKRKAQEEIQAEWERRRHEFRSYGEFLEASLMESEWGRETLRGLRFPKSAGPRQDTDQKP